MITVAGYSNLQIVHQSAETLVYSATRSRDGEKVILRHLRPEVASPERVAQFRKEFELLSAIDSPHVIKALALVEQNATPILVTGNFGGENLGTLIQQQKISLREAVDIAIAITSGLDHLHAENIIHKNINPENVIYNPLSRELRIIDLGIASALTSSSVKTEPDVDIEGTLAYLAPEQTGRMNRSIDYRTDFYGLGATLYELLTGQPPFPTEDSLQLVYNHIAATPPSPDTINASVPRGLCNVIMKLLAKMPEDRYQSTFAIKQDLLRCRELIGQRTGNTADVEFEVALDDISEHLNIPERLLERDGQFRQLRDCLAEVAKGGTEVVVCAGDAGSGKSSLIRELQREVTALGGCLASGRHNLMSPERPYTAISSAFRDLVRQLLARPDISAVKHRVATALEGNERLMIELVPELKLLVGEPRPATGSSQPTQSRHRLIQGLSGLIRAVCKEGKPLVLCIENLHWIDQASIELFEPLVTAQKLPYFMLVCAYGTGELPAESGIRETLERIPRQHPRIKVVRLGNLSARSIATLISESLSRPEDETLALAGIIHGKTNGNPLAIREFLGELQRKDIVRFDRDHREWVWDLEAAGQEPPTENVSALLADRIQLLEPVTAHLLKIASCAGEEFDLDTIRNVSGLSFSETSARLLHAVREGYLIHRPAPSRRPADRKLFYRFSHERIQQAAYTLLTSNQRRKIHTSIGHSYLETYRDNTEDNIFDIVNQLNNSFESPDAAFVDKNKLAELNLAAGRKARKSAAFQSSFKYFKTAIALYGQNVWAQYEASLEMHLEAAETAYLCGDRQQLELLIDRTLKHARDPLDQSRAWEIKLRALVALNELDSAIDLGHEVLALLGVPLRQGTGRLQHLLLLLRLLVRTARINEKDVADATPMQDPTLLAVMRILMILCQAGYLAGSDSTSMYILKMTQLSLRHGMAPESSFAYPMFGALLIAYLGTIDSGYHFGMLASNNLDENNKDLHCKAITLVHNFIRVWKHPVRESLEALTNAYRIGMETGDIEFALFAATTGATNAFLLGHELNSLDANFASYNEKANEFNQVPVLSSGSIYQQAVRNLLQPNAAPWLLEGDVYSENELLQFRGDHADESSIANLYIVKLFLAMLFNHPEPALEFAREARDRLTSVVSSPVVPFFVLYESLACVAHLGSSPPWERFKLRARINNNQRKFRKWAQHAPENILHGYHLVEAELSRIRGDVPGALEHYDQAIALSQENGFLKEHGLANELAGRFHFAAGKRELGLFYMRHARASYLRWGAMGKVSDLDREFIELGEDEYLQRRTRHYSTSASGAFPARNLRGYGNFLDLDSVIKASQVLSGEIILDNLLERLMQVALENAGAHNASLILSRDGELVVEIATRYNGTTSENVRENIPVSEATSLPVSVVQYVARTLEDLVLNDALNEDIFTQDEYIISHQPKSILCIPILSKSHLTGVMYLENLQTTLAFTQDRVAILKLLASQSAIAIENAKLYQQLNDSRNKYLSLYQNAVEGIFELDQNLQFTNINPAAAQLLGFESPEDALDRLVFRADSIFVNPEDQELLGKILREQGRVVGFELQIRKRNHEALWVALSAQVFTSEDTPGEFHIEGSIIDITERKLREEAEQATRIAEAATESKGQFLANMSHEIRTPMNAIIGYTDLALRTELSEQQANYLETIRNSSNHLLRVVNDILDLSKVESGKLGLQKVPFKLADIFKDLHNLFSLEARERGLQFNMPGPDSLDEVYYVGDPVRIGQVLINLVSNAMKFTDTGEIRVEFEPYILQDDRISVNFAVSDTGIGIDESELEYIFESFAQGNITSRNSGTGLGLAICKSLVKMMGGHIHAVSEKHKGSTFYFSVVVDQWDERTPPMEPFGSEQQLQSLDGQKILVVEDNRINQDLAREVLTQAGIKVRVADDGQQALDMLQREQFFAVLMDLRMPVMDGIEAIRHIRANKQLASLPTIALSAGVLQNEVDEALAAGFDHYLGKPVDFTELLGLLGQIGGFSPREGYAQRVAAAAGTSTIRREIRGVDFGRALRNHVNDEELLARLMAEFLKIYDASDQQLREFIATGQQSTAERLAHNIAGVAGSFGATDLMLSARTIEHRLMAGETELDVQLSEFSRELRNFIRAIEQYRTEASIRIKASAG